MAERSYRKIFKNYTYFFKNWFTTPSPDTHIETLGANQKIRNHRQGREYETVKAISF